MSTYILVHGAWHGAWAWEKLVPLLEAEGHRVLTPDLPGHGSNPAPVGDMTLERYARAVCEALEAASEPAIVVGHSMGGIVITQAAEQCPDKIATLVYLCAFLPANGESLLQHAQQDTESIILPTLGFDEANGVIHFNPDTAAEIFYNECTSEDVERSKMRLVDEAIAPLVAPVRMSAERFGRIPRVYIECLRDRAIGPSSQKRMYTATACRQVITMDTGHSPFLSKPEELAGHLLALTAPVAADSK